MKIIWVICKKELNSYFRSPIAYLVMTFFAIIAGFFFWLSTGFFVNAGMQQMMGGGGPMSVNEWVIRPVLGNISVIGMFLIPMITMRLFAEENRSGTIELLVTSPISDFEIILGKWFAALILYACILAIAGVNFLVLFVYGKPDWRPMLVGFLGLLLQGGVMLAIGAFISTTTKNQIVAGVATFAISLLLWVINWVSEFSSSTTAKVVAYFSMQQHYDSFGKGVIDTKDVIFYLSMIFLGLFLSARSLESLRWRS